jgi:HEAT repeat protein
MANFDAMPDELRPVTGHLVRKLDPEVADKLAGEMGSLSPVRRRRAVLAAGTMGMAHDVEKTLIGLLSDEDHMVRRATAKILADCKSMPTWEALRDAVFDRSVIVQEAAERSMEQISNSLLQRVQKGAVPETEKEEEGVAQ